ncbi:hypothetical protein FKM82_024475 [Ascaphus truei]
MSIITFPSVSGVSTAIKTSVSVRDSASLCWGPVVHLIYTEVPSEHSDARDCNCLLKGSDVRLILSRYFCSGPQRGSHRFTGTQQSLGTATEPQEQPRRYPCLSLTNPSVTGTLT